MKLSVLILFLSIAPIVVVAQVRIESRYSAGFKTLHLQDTARLYKPNTAKEERLHFRPIEVDIWYPSLEKGIKQMLFRELFSLFEERAMAYQDNTDYTGITEELASFYVAQLGVGTDGKALLDIQTDSYSDLTPTEEAHPVVVYLAGFNGMGFENYKVLEQLAAHGFVVLAISSVGRYPGDMTNQKEDMMEQVYDAEFAMDHLVKGNAPLSIDSTKTGVLGCSWGGMSAAVLANRNPNIEAMISLDGSEIHYAGDSDTNLYADGASAADNDRYIKEIQDANLLNPGDQRFTYLYLESGDKLDDFHPTSVYDYFKKLDTEKYYLRFTNSSHADFTCIPSILHSSKASSSIYDKIEKTCLHFFNSTLSRDDTFTSYWSNISTTSNTTVEPFDITKKEAEPAGQMLKGIVLSKQTSEPLPFVNIGVMDQNWGTVSNAEGTFSLELNENHKGNTLRISMIGYHPVEILINEIEVDSLPVELNERIDQLQEVIVAAKAFKYKRLGNKTQSKFLGTGFGYDQLGAEMGIKINIRKQPTYVDAFNFTISHNRLSTETIFRLNFYSLEKGKPTNNILRENIFINIDPEQTGTISIDLSPYDMVLKEDVLVTLEWVGSVGKNKEGEAIYFPLTLVSNGTFYKPSSQSKFKKHNSLGVGFNLDVRF